jgi:hypothetical protein
LHHISRITTVETTMQLTKTQIAKSAIANGSADPSHAIPDADLPQEPTLCLDEMIAVAAYFYSERRGFAPGNELADWLRAEAECTNRLKLNS